MRRFGDLLYVVGIACSMAVIALLALDALPPCVHAQATSWPLAWTAPPDNVGVTAYKVFWSTTTQAAPDTTGFAVWFAAGTPVATMPAGINAWTIGANNMNGPVPLPAGSAQTLSIPFSFAAGVKYYSMVKSCDAAGNCAYSNFAIRTTQTVDTAPPLAIRDLRTAP